LQKFQNTQIRKTTASKVGTRRQIPTKTLCTEDSRARFPDRAIRSYGANAGTLMESGAPPEDSEFNKREIGLP
jgi:hypothetical protein